jgi:4-amino-4-deoxy-L-arabinose transferase-like glycosyltransferase
VLAWLWVRVFGDTEAGLRSLSALAGVLTVTAAFAAARNLATTRAALVAALLVAVSSQLVWYGQEARCYSLLVLTTTVALWLWSRTRGRPTAGRLMAWGGAAALALATHYFAAFALLPQALLVLADRRARRRWRSLAVAIPAAAGLGLAGLARAQNGGHQYWFGDSSLHRRVDQIITQWLAGFSPPAGRVAVFVAAGAAGAGLALLALRARPAERRGAASAALVGGCAVGLPMALALAGVDYLDARNVLSGLVPCAIVVAAGMGAARARVAGPLVAAVLVAVSLAMIVALARDPLAQRGPWRHVAAALAAHPGRHAILIRGSRTWGSILTYYLPRTWWVPRHGAPVRDIYVLRRLRTPHDCHQTTWWGATCDLGARPAARRPPAHGFHRVGTERVAGFEIVHYRSRHAVRIYAHTPLDHPHGPHRSPHHQALLTPTHQVLPGSQL